MTNITKNKITINSIIEFVHTAMYNNLIVTTDYPWGEFGYSIDNGREGISFNIEEKYFEIISEGGSLKIDYSLTERDKIDLQTLNLDIDEYREDKAFTGFNNFFLDVIDKPTSIDDLDNDEE